VELKLERCTIRDWRMDDAPSLATNANNRNVSLWLRDAFPHPYSIEDARNFLERSTTDQPRKNFCIEINRAAVGGIGVLLGEDIHRRTAEFGYWLGEEFWGRGVMSEAVPAFANYCFETFQLRRLYAKPFGNNPASARVLEKAGFVLEGRLRNNVIKDGKILDSLLYARTM
jgi:ribosomal-protein-alanine N-acetyltransferase